MNHVRTLALTVSSKLYVFIATLVGLVSAPVPVHARRIKSHKGLSLLEYAIMAAVILIIAFFFRAQLSTLFSQAVNTINTKWSSVNAG